MESFINLMSDDVWTEADIVARTEAMIASEFSPAFAAILNRKATGALLGQYTLSAEEQAELGRYAICCDAARAAGNAARQDVALLAEAKNLWLARQRLQLPEIGPEEQELYAIDLAERSAALLVIETVSNNAINLLELRRGPILVETNFQQE